LKIHIGELDPSKLVYWRYDIIEAFYVDKCQFLWACFCPPLVQMQTRNKIISRCEELPDSDPRKTPGFTQTPFQLVWIVGYWSLFLLVILFCFLDLAEEGFIHLAGAMWLFWVVLCVGNRQLIKSHYGIDSSNICFDILSWGCCWCYAGVQENLQARDGKLVDLVVGGKKATVNAAVEMQRQQPAAQDIGLQSDSGGAYTE